MIQERASTYFDLDESRKLLHVLGGPIEDRSAIVMIGKECKCGQKSCPDFQVAFRGIREGIARCPLTLLYMHPAAVYYWAESRCLDRLDKKHKAGDADYYEVVASFGRCHACQIQPRRVYVHGDDSGEALMNLYFKAFVRHGQISLLNKITICLACLAKTVEYKDFLSGFGTFEKAEFLFSVLCLDRARMTEKEFVEMYISPKEHIPQDWQRDPYRWAPEINLERQAVRYQSETKIETRREELRRIYQFSALNGITNDLDKLGPDWQNPLITFHKE